MSVSGIRAGRAFVEVFLKDRMTEGLGGLQTRLKTFQIGADRLAGSLFRGGAVLGAPLVLAAKQAASAQEELSRFGAVFGELEGSASGFADNLADSIGRSPVEIKKAMASFQSLFVGLGFGKKESQGFSQEMQSLALDFASFNNITDQDALERFISGLSGSSEVFARFGINTKASAIDQELLAMGIKATTATLTTSTLRHLRKYPTATVMGTLFKSVAHSHTSLGTRHRTPHKTEDTPKSQTMGNTN